MIDILALLEDDEPLTQEDLDFVEKMRPKTRADCASIPRPCPFLLCAYHLWSEVPMRKFAKNREDWWQRPVGVLDHSCSLDVADQGEHSLEEVGALLHLTRERVRQIEFSAKAKLAGDRVERWLETLSLDNLELIDAISEYRDPA